MCEDNASWNIHPPTNPPFLSSIHPNTASALPFCLLFLHYPRIVSALSAHGPRRSIRLSTCFPILHSLACLPARGPVAYQIYPFVCLLPCPSPRLPLLLHVLFLGVPFHLFVLLDTYLPVRVHVYPFLGWPVWLPSYLLLLLLPSEPAYLHVRLTILPISLAPRMSQPCPTCRIQSLESRIGFLKHASAGKAVYA
ncbi:hypothetical protein EJ05DRAFT_137851 [Pseudovirgaria hyperparasitica]|uniref:Uncharacterized protein n=1 Tax=Pseudovirgaria hyperparasitica TaxID=470096 RepID=A0A6A6VYU1_9PEZI|nr:uncharacterized protein EJ05DRAFT_137851 [Pseudovirgaria hyperparasitica]KAF2754914.1 hypothetical protein EJ05DRAFT_137851 [Pseudovirgaria hyperparasitica]